MTTLSDHEQLQELVPAAALGALDGAESERVLAHARECRICGALLEEYRAVAAELALGLASHPMAADRSARLKARLMARALREQQGGGERPGRSALAGRWTGWAVAAGLSGVLIVHHAVHRPLDYGWLVAGVLAVGLVLAGTFAVVLRGRVSSLRRRTEEYERAGE